MMQLTDMALSEMYSILTGPEHIMIHLSKSYLIEEKINTLRSECRKSNLTAVNSGQYSYHLGTFFNDFIAECEKVGDYVVNVVQAEAGE